MTENLENNFITKHMAKVILEFESTEEQSELRAALDGWKWAAAMWILDQKLRETTKHGVSILENKAASDLEFKIADKYRELIREILDEHKIFFE